MLQTTGGRKIVRINFSCLVFLRRNPFQIRTHNRNNVVFALIIVTNKVSYGTDRSNEYRRTLCSVFVVAPCIDNIKYFIVQCIQLHKL